MKAGVDILMLEEEMGLEMHWLKCFEFVNLVWAWSTYSKNKRKELKIQKAQKIKFLQ